MTHPQTGEVSTITLEDAITNSLRRLEEMVFADGTVISGDWLTSFKLVGTAGDDSIVGTNAGEQIDAGNGNDIVDGGLGNNTLDGGAGDDTLKIASAASSTKDYSNTFIGGLGNDRLEGAFGADTYVYNLGDGNDVIADKDAGYGKVDRLVFGEGITKEHIALQRNGNHLVVLVTHPQTGEVSIITLEDAITNSLRRLEEMVFADGTVISGDWFSSIAAYEEPQAVQQAMMSTTSVTTFEASSSSFKYDNGNAASSLRNELRNADVSDSLAIKAYELKHHRDVVMADTSFSLALGNELPKSDLARELDIHVSTGPAPSMANKQAKHKLLINDVDTQHANLIDALNAFDGDDDAALDGNMAIAPKLEQYFY